MPYAIEQNVPLPPPRNNSSYPFDQLDVGESFLVECDTNNPNGKRIDRNVRSNATSANNRLAPKKFTCRRVVEGDTPEEEVVGTRVWRVV